MVPGLSTAHLLPTLCAKGCLCNNAGRAAMPLTLTRPPASAGCLTTVCIDCQVHTGGRDNQFRAMFVLPNTCR